jgi:hypothetical protein
MLEIRFGKINSGNLIMLKTDKLTKAVAASKLLFSSFFGGSEFFNF